MSPSPGNGPQTPDTRNSSATILGAFRLLTGGRSKITVQSSPSPTTALTSAQAAFFRHDSKSTDATAASGGRTGGSRGSSASAGKARFVGEVVGGPPELDQLLEQLGASNPLDARIVAAHKICAILDEYPVSNVLAIWERGSDMIYNEGSVEASIAGYSLLKSCVTSSDLTPIERRTFFESIYADKGPRDLDRRFQVIVDLTNNGRNVEALEPLIVPIIVDSLRVCFAAVKQARKRERKTKSQTAAKEEDQFTRIFQFIIDVTKFNSKVLQEEELKVLLDEIISICRHTSTPSDIQASINVVDALVTYTHVPTTSLQPCLELLCDVFKQVSSLQEQIWETLRNILRSHLGQLAITVLLDILQGRHKERPRPGSIVRGASRAVRRLVLADGADGLPRISMPLVMRAVRSSLEGQDHKHRTDILEFYADVLSHDHLAAKLLKEEDWTDFVDTIHDCVEGQVSGELGLRGDQSGSNASISTEMDVKGRSDSLATIIEKLLEYASGMDFVHKAAVMDLFVRLGCRLPDDAAEATISYYAEEHLLYPSHDDWQKNAQDLIGAFLKDQLRASYLRTLALGVFREAYDTLECLCEPAVVEDFARSIFENISEERDAEALNALADFAAEIAVGAPNDLFENILEYLRAPIDEHRSSSVSSHAGLGLWTSSLVVTRSSETLGSLCNIVTRAIVRMFIRCVNTSAVKAQFLYDVLLHVAGSDFVETDARISALKLLFRLRSDSSHAIIVNASSEGHSMAAVLCRTAETAAEGEHVEETPPRQARTEDRAVSKETRGTSTSSPHISLSRQKPAKLSKPVPPLWMYPGPRGLPEDPPLAASHLLTSYIEAPDDSSDDAPLPTRSQLKIALWVELLISILQQGSDWEVYSYVLVHLGAQLTNHSLFSGAIRQIQMLRSVLCEQMITSTFHEPPGYTSLKKADVAACIYHTMTMLISYNAHFAKSEQDDLVRAFYGGIGNWERTAKWCIHALSVCCHELPLSLSKSLDGILQRMAQVITQPHLAVDILEFLAGLARLPEVYRNFRENDFRMVFGICFRYLQSVRDQKDRASYPPKSAHNTLRRSGSHRNVSAMERDIKVESRSPSDGLPQYVYALAFHVITFWFMALKLQDRPGYVEWISKNLTYKDNAGRDVVEDQSLVTIDMMQRVAFSDRDETVADPNFAKPADGEVVSKSWIVGLSLMTIETAGRTGVSQITRRRPSATKFSIYRPQLTSPPRHQVPLTTGLAADVFYTSSYVGVLPDDIFQEFYAPIASASTTTGTAPDLPVPLPDDEATQRAISIFDRNSTVDGHKVGVIYIGDGQTTEKEIFANVMGSSDYTAFVAGLGTLTRLKGATFNTQGLDREFDSDGEFTYCWRDRVTEIVFHITTMMPTNLEHDPLCVNKKRHTGNDFVNIVFNNSGLPFKFDTFPSDFNYVYIVISPEARISFSESRLHPAGQDQFYKVQVMCKPGFPEISPAAETKIISGKSLPGFVRLVALNASVFSLVWANREGGEHVSSWRNRLREIKKLRERHCGRGGPLQVVSHTPPSTTTGNTTGQGLASPPPRDSGVGGIGGGVFKRASVATLMSDAGVNSVHSSSTDMERQEGGGA